MYYNESKSGAEHKGDSVGKIAEIWLETGEFITTVTGRSDPGGGTAGYLEFTSNRGKLPLSIPRELLLM